MSVDHLPLHQHQEEGEGIQRTLSSARLTMTGYLESINDNADEKDEGIFFWADPLLFTFAYKNHLFEQR